ncbi:MAG: RDD family protein [Bacilli bacterium]|nr:RDD family protein [Bacilli bacterium]
MAENDVITLTYEKAGLAKRVIAFLIDALIIGTMALGFFWTSRLIVENASWYRGAFDEYVSISSNSKLYVYAETDDNLVQIDTYAKGTYKDDGEIASFLETRLAYFYVDDPIDIFADGEGKKIYDAEKVGANAIKQADGSYYFALDSQGEPQSIVSSSVLIAFYEQATISAIEYLNRSEAYVNAKKTLSQTINLLLIPLSISLSFLIFELLVPLLFFRRGYKTIGMAVFHFALLNAEAVVPKFRFFLFRFLFMLIVEVLVSMMTFGVPLFVTVGFLVVRKDGQALHDFISGTYMVDATEQSVYFSREEYLALQAKAQDTSSRPFLTSWYRDSDMLPPRTIEPKERKKDDE